MYIPQTIIDDIMREIKFNGEAFVCNEENANYFATIGYDVQETNIGFRHWVIKRGK